MIKGTIQQMYMYLPQNINFIKQMLFDLRQERRPITIINTLLSSMEKSARHNTSKETSELIFTLNHLE
jgi:hypothetical protein